MLKRYWVVIAAFGLIAVSAFAYWGFASLAEYKREHSEQRQRISSYQADTTDQDLGVCLGVAEFSLTAVLNCMNDRAKASRESQATQYDLTAQQEMAEWAFALLLVSLFGVFISIAGLLALFVSLSQTRTAIKDTREIGEAQVRAYVGLPVLQDTGHATGGVWPKLKFRIENSGTTPAWLKYSSVRNIRVSSRNSNTAISLDDIDDESPNLVVPQNGSQTFEFDLVGADPTAVFTQADGGHYDLTSEVVFIFEDVFKKRVSIEFAATHYMSIAWQAGTLDVSLHLGHPSNLKIEYEK